MTTANELIQQAHREGNLIPVGTQPTTAQINEALGRLNNIITSLFGNEIGEPLFEWPVLPPQQTSPINARWPLAPGLSIDQTRLESAWPYPPCNVRLMASNTVEKTIWLQYMPNDGARVAYRAVSATADLVVQGNGRRVEGASSVIVEPTDNAGERLWFYRADLGDWIRIQALGLTDQSPLPDEFDDFLICALSIRLSSRFGNEPRQGTLLTFKDQLAKLKARYRQPTAVLGGSWQAPNTIQAYPQQTGFGSL